MTDQTAAPSQTNNKKTAPSRLRIGKRYRAERVDADYDAIVIGSGIGGLCSAALLSQMGKKVIVLEQHYTAGGFTHAYALNWFNVSGSQIFFLPGFSKKALAPGSSSPTLIDNILT